MYFQSKVFEWGSPVFPDSCSFDDTVYFKEVRGRWVDVSYFGRKIINCHCCLMGCGLKWNGSKFLSCHHKTFADDLIDL